MPITRDTRSTAPRHTPSWTLAPILLLLAGILPTAASAPLLDEETETLLVDAVTAAAELDLYEARCRGDRSGRRTDNLNKELVGKLGMTVLGVEDDLFPERSYRRVKERLERDFLDSLKDAGGCPEAKASDLPETLNARYRELLEAVRALP
ncbi:hypothetical protein [Imhoffiella purpurea]|uniref:Uncharacterized protein n=1 Tax=Imhoffiella purpurea TaxID=1249627 RepID=W9W010_9GAMM|nr:hypothetical protein [Imhoffiella purpurea]EXJ15955.1 hypothetical protein D779_0703 [Imhoffiella purpurea]